MTDRIHIAYCDQCGDEICEGDAHRVERLPVYIFLDGIDLVLRGVPLPTTRYTCERCIAGEARPT